MKGTYTYAELAKKYGNFFSPVMKVKVGESDVIEKLHLAISDINITLSKESAGIAAFQIAGIYDDKSHSFDSGVKSKFELGTIVEIEIGYRSDTKLVFKGIVASRGAAFYGTPLLSIQLADVRNLMMTGSKKRYYQVKNYSDAFSEVMKDYRKLCSVKADDTNDGLTAPVAQDGSDYDFIMHKMIRGQKLDREFFIVGENAYFRKPSANSDVIMTVSYGRELLSFSQHESYAGITVHITGYDAEKGEMIKESAAVNEPSGQKKAMSKTPDWYFWMAGADSPEKAKKIAQAIASQKKKKGKTANAEIIGLPELVPGRHIKVEGMDTIANGTYYINEVSHSIGSGGFTTSLQLEGSG